MKKKIRNYLCWGLISLNLLSCQILNFDEPDDSSSEYRLSWYLLRDYFFWVDKIPNSPSSFSTPEELYKSVNDPYTEYYNPQRALALLDIFDNKTVGMGIHIRNSEDGIVVERVFSGSPAQRAGVLPNDTIVQIGDSLLTKENEDYFSEFLRGQEGEVKHLKIRRGKTVMLEVTLAGYIAPSVFIDSLSPDVFRLQITSFIGADDNSPGTAVEINPYLERLKNSSHLILDLRHNGGGEVNVTLEIAGMFLGAGKPLVKVQERDPGNPEGNKWGIYNRTLESTGNPSLTDKVLYVLMDEYSASASEILITGLKKHYPGVVTVGAQSYGKARGQLVFYNPPQLKGLAKITAMLIEPIEGQSYDEVGISPDVLIEKEEDALDYTLAEIDSNLVAAKAGIKKQGFKKIQLDNFNWEPLLYFHK